MGLIRARIIVEGRVQKVGYRDLVQSLAWKLGVKGYAENLKDGTVQIVCEADEDILERFIREINVKEEFIEVERVQIIERSEATGEFKYFEIKYGRLGEEFGERMGTAIEYANAMRGDIQSMHKDLRNMHKDLKSETVAVKEAIGEMHKDLKEDTVAIKNAIGEMHKDLRGEIVGLRGEFKDMHVDMNRSFEEMAKRYDVISQELVRTREELTRAVDTLVDLVKQFIKRG